LKKKKKEKNYYIAIKMNKTQIVIIDVIRKDNLYLMTLRNQPETPKFHNKWQFPGGGLEFREHPIETAVREAQE
jgi:8-oxo-dGTP pyrophosphatase MutT (NUDIX family)